MKKIFLLTMIVFALSIWLPAVSSAQGMMGFRSLSFDSATIQSQQQEEREGEQLLNDLNNKITTCVQLSDSDFEKMGEYFMGQSIGDTSRHIAMNEMMKRMMGEKGEEQAHVVMGKRLSGCDTSAAFPLQDVGLIPMAYMMGGWSATPSSGKYFGYPNSMMNFDFVPDGWIIMLLFWGLVIYGIVALVRWLFVQNRDENSNDKSAFEILKERYAKGEINKKEFEEKKKDLS